MFGSIGGPELLLILVIALIVFGPRKLPEIGKSMGSMLAEFRKASNDFRRTIEEEVEADKRKESAGAPPPAALPEPPAEAVLAAPPTPEPAAETVSREAPPPPIEPK